MRRTHGAFLRNQSSMLLPSAENLQTILERKTGSSIWASHEANASEIIALEVKEGKKEVAKQGDLGSRYVVNFQNPWITQSAMCAPLFRKQMTLRNGIDRHRSMQGRRVVFHSALGSLQRQRRRRRRCCRWISRLVMRHNARKDNIKQHRSKSISIKAASELHIYGKRGIVCGLEKCRSKNMFEEA